MKKQLKPLLAAVLVLVLLFSVACAPTECKEHNYVNGVCTVCGAKEPAAKKLMRIGITTQPTKTEYTVGEKFDPTGMVVTAFYNDSTKEVVTDYTFDKTGELTREDTSVKISYNGKTATVRISVRGAFVLNEALTISNADNAVYTVEAESLDFSSCTNSNDHSLQPNIEAPAQQHPVTSGGKCASTLSVIGNKFGFVVTSEVEANLTIVIRAAATHLDIAIDDMMTVTWNQAEIKSGKTLPWTAGQWFNWDHAFYKELKLNKGRNELLLTVSGNNAPNFDCFYLIVSPTGDEELPETIGAPAPVGPVKTIEVENGNNAVYTVEAEELDYSDCVSMRGDGTTHSVEEPAQEYPVTSGGKSVGALSVSGNKFGFVVNSKVAAKVTVVMRAAPTETDMDLDKFLSVTWNGTEVKSGKTLIWNTDHAHWFDWDHAYFTNLDLVEGENKFEVTVVAHDEQGSVNAPNFDCFYLIVAPTGSEKLLGTINGESSEPHVCESKCPKCNLCQNKDCTEEVCNDKCQCEEEPQPEADVILTNGEENVYTIEAEDLDYSNCVNSNDPNSTHNVETPAQSFPLTSGGKSVGALSVNGNKFGFTVYSKKATTVTIVMRASAAFINLNADDVMTAMWNGTEVKSNKLFKWNDDYAHWFDWDHAFFKNLTVNEGVNNFEITVKERLPGVVNFLNLDCFYVIENATGNEILPECMSTITINAATAGIYKVEAENLDYSGCTFSNGSATTTFEANTDGGTNVIALSIVGNKVRFEVNNLTDAVIVAKLIIRASANEAAMNLDDLLKITVNGVEVKTGDTLDWNGTWNNCSTATAEGITLNTGKNVIELEVLLGGCPNLDYFAIEIA